MIDAAYAPMFMRMDFINTLTGVNLLAKTPKLANWSKNLLAMKCVQESVVPELPTMYKGMLKQMNGYLATLLKD